MRERINSQIKEEMGKNQPSTYFVNSSKPSRKSSAKTTATRAISTGSKSASPRRTFPAKPSPSQKKQLKRLRSMQVGSAEYTVVRTYLDWILDLPWTNTTQDIMDISAVRKVLDEDHYGLEKVKKRILEFCSAQAEAGQKGPILCLIGPPGVGRRRSVGASRGPRTKVRSHLARRRSRRGRHPRTPRTYVGALPGQIIQGMKKAGTINPSS